MMPVPGRSKPALEIYRPPTLRSPVPITKASGAALKPTTAPVTSHVTNVSSSVAPPIDSSLNVNAREFQPSSATPSGNRAASGQQEMSSTQRVYQQSTPRHSATTKTRQVSFGPDGDAPASAGGSTNYQLRPALRRSHTMGAEMCTTLRQRQQQQQQRSSPDALLLAKLGQFNPEVQKLVEAALVVGGSMSGRSVMDLVRHLFTRLVESSRYAEPTARYSVAVVERESGNTYLETLINTCQEWYQERDKLLRSNNTLSTYSGGFVPASPRWIAYVTFINELYTMLKRAHLISSVGVADGESTLAPSVATLLQLLTECCLVTLRANSVNSLAEIECVFMVMTSIGRDLEREWPSRLDSVLSTCRDTLLNTPLTNTVSKTLLQLVELHAARWQLPASTVMYYYPMSAV